jgi:hypothetical protein
MIGHYQSNANLHEENLSVNNRDVQKLTRRRQWPISAYVWPKLYGEMLCITVRRSLEFRPSNALITSFELPINTARTEGMGPNRSLPAGSRLTDAA